MFHKKSETQWILPFSGEGKCVSPTSADRQGPAGLWRLRYRHERTCECCQNMSKPVLCGLCFGEVNWSEVSQMSRVIHLKAIVAIVYNGDIIHNIYICIYIWHTMVTWCYMRQRWKPVLGIVGVPFDPETLSMAFWDFPFFGPSGRFPPFGKLGWNLGLSENRLLWISTITITYYHYPGLSPLIMSWVYHGIPHF